MTTGGLIASAVRQAKIEKARRLQFIQYQKDPMLWLKERLKENPIDYQWSKMPGYENHKWDGDIDPLYTVWQALANGKKRAAVESATGTGKTFALARIVLWFLDCFEDALVVTSAPKQAQLTLHLWAEIQKIFHKFKRLRSKAQLYNLRLVVEDKDEKEDFNLDQADLSKSWHAVGFVAGIGSEEQSATKAQGFHRKNMLILVEETPGMPNAIMTAFKQTSVGSNNLILAVGNPDSQLDPLHKFAMLPGTVAVRISAYDYPNVVLGREIIPGAVTRSSIEDRRLELGVESSLYKSRVRGISPAQSTDSLIKMEWVERAFKAKLPYDGGYHAVGVDVANSTDGDKAATAWGKGNALKYVKAFFCPNANHLAYNLFMSPEQLISSGYEDFEIPKLGEYDIIDGFIGVDPVGVGVATVNTLMDNGFHPISLSGSQWEEAIPEEEYVNKDNEVVKKPMYKFRNIRAQMYYELREDLRRGKVCFDFDEEDKELEETIKNQLVSIKVIYKDNGITIESKEDYKKRTGGKSPNEMDAIVYWNWTRKGYRADFAALPVG